MLKILTTFFCCIFLLWPPSSQAKAGPETRTIVVGYEEDSAPYVFNNAQGEPDGFSIALFKLIARQQGLHIQFRAAPWNESLLALERGEIDAVTAMGYSAQRAQNVILGTPYLNDELALFHRKGSAGVTSLDALQGKKVLVLRSSIEHEYLLENTPGAEPVQVDRWPQVLSRLAVGEADYAIMPKFAGLYIINQLQLSTVKRLALADANLMFRYSMAVRPGARALLEQLNTGMAQVRGSGQLDRLHQQWFGEFEVKTFDRSKVMPVVAWTVGGIIGLLAVILAWTLLLKKQVRLKTQSLEAEVIERKQAEARFRNLFEYAPDATVIVDDQGVICMANRKIEALFGWSPAELEGQMIEVLVPEGHEQHGELYKNFRAAPSFRAMLPDQGSLLAARKDGTFFPVEVCLGPVETQGKAMVAATIRDMSDRLQQEQDHQALLVAEQENAAKSTFLATMSHEIRTPMNGVIGCLDLFDRSDLAPHQQELLETMHESSFTLLRVIDDILDFSKIEAGQLELEREPICPERVVESVCLAMKPAAVRKQLKLDVFIDPRLPQLILSDSVRLRQIVSNLLANAIKFTPHQGGYGKITVRAELTGESQLRLKVSDNGIGIAAEAQGRLFQPFVQAESSTTRHFGGSGLGLSICKRLTEMFEGSIEVDSELGRGTTFSVTLPIEIMTESAPSVSPDLGGLYCLVVARNMMKAQDWCLYLDYAGALSEPVADREMAQRRLVELTPETTAVIIEEETVEVARQWLDALALDAKPALVVVDRGNRHRARQVAEGVAMIDSDAMTCSAFLQAVGMSTNRLQEQPPEELPAHLGQVLAPPDRETAIEQGRLILVAEDNGINQKIISRQLALLGYAADVAGNGRAALHAWQQGCYALLLTDLHMPEMDGYELTQAIRDEESGTAQLPIIAITADVFNWNVDRCADKGMNGYLSKPLVLDKLKASLEKWLPEVGMDEAPEEAVVTAQSAGIADKKPLDTAILASLIGDEPALMAEFLLDFRHSAEQASLQMHTAWAAGEWKEVRDVAHRLKSSSRAVGALILGECCEQIELAPGMGDDALLKEFELVLSDVLSEIDKIKGSS